MQPANKTSRLLQIILAYGRPMPLFLIHDQLPNENRHSTNTLASQLARMGFLKRVDTGYYTATDKTAAYIGKVRRPRARSLEIFRLFVDREFVTKETYTASYSGGYSSLITYMKSRGYVEQVGQSTYRITDSGREYARRYGINL